MIIIEALQGSKEWHVERQKDNRRTASEASSIMGSSQYCSRTQLLDMKKFGIEKEVSSYTKMFIFEKGHKAEADARIILENDIDDDLYPVTGVTMIEGINLLASFDGLTLMEETIYEHKQWNAELAKVVSSGHIPASHKWQLVHQQLVSGAKKVIFVVSDGTKENWAQCDFVATEKDFKQLIAGWKQFNEDLKSHEYIAQIPKPVTTEIAYLPKLSITTVGEITHSNLAIYKEKAVDVIGGLNKELIHDEHFAQAKVDIKFCANVESTSKIVKKDILAGNADIKLAVDTLTEIESLARETRLFLSKQVKVREEQIKQDIVNKASSSIYDHIKSINEKLSPLNIGDVEFDFYAGIKGKRNLSSMRDAVDTELARAKIQATELSNIARSNLDYFESVVGEYRFLFNDLQSFINSDFQIFSSIVDSRIIKHQESEKIKAQAERERIQAEEQAKAEAIADRKLEEERKLIKAEEQAKADAMAHRKIEEERKLIQAEEQTRSEEKRIKMQKQDAAQKKVEDDRIAAQPVEIKKHKQNDGINSAQEIVNKRISKELKKIEAQENKKITLSIGSLSAGAIQDNDSRDAVKIKLGDVEFMFVDGEPEDNNLARNFSDVYRIQKMILKAYKAGKEGIELVVNSYQVDEF